MPRKYRLGWKEVYSCDCVKQSSRIILALLFINYSVTFHTINSEPTFASHTPPPKGARKPLGSQ